MPREKVLESHFNWMNFTIFLYFPFKSLSNLRTLCNLVYSIWSILTKWVLRVLPCAFCQTLYKSGSQGIFDFTITYVAYLFLISSLINLLVVKNRSSLVACLIPKYRYMIKYGSKEKGSSLCKCSILLGFFMSKKQERLLSELLSEDIIRR